MWLEFDNTERGTMRRGLVNITVISTLLYGNFSLAMLVGEPDNLSRTLSTTNTAFIHEEDYKTWFNAARSGDLEKIKSLMDKNIDINQVNKYRKTALECAARGGHIKVVRLLLEKRKDFFSETALLRALDNAVQGGRINIVEFFLERGINPSFDTLSKASRKGYIKIVRLLLEKRKDVFSETDLSSELDSAAKNGRVSIAELFLKNGVEPKISSNVIINLLKGDSVDRGELSKTLNKAALTGNIEVFKFLLDRHADLFYKSVPNYALLNAAYCGHTEIVEFLLNKCPNLFDKFVLSDVLYGIVQNGYTKIVRLLLNKGIKPDSCTLETAVEKKRTEIVRLFLKNSGDSFDEDILSRALSKAVEKGEEKIVELLLDHGGVDPNFQYIVNTNISKYGSPVLRSGITEPMLINTLKNGHEKISKLLLSRCNVPFDNIVLTNALNYAAESGYTEVVKLLLDKGANPNGMSYTLEVAAKKGYTEIVRLLLKRNAKPSQYVLGLAAWNGHRKIVELLLNKWGGSDLFDEAVLSYALSNAVEREDINIVELLVNNGADPERTAPYGSTSVFLKAIQKGNREIVGLFLKKGVNPDFQDDNGYTALMYAAEFGHIEIVKLLTENKVLDLILKGKNKLAMTDSTLKGLIIHGGVDLNLRNRRGDTALVLAEKRGYTDIVRWLKNLQK